jgi:hypothetical protein
VTARWKAENDSIEKTLETPTELVIDENAFSCSCLVVEPLLYFASVVKLFCSV